MFKENKIIFLEGNSDEPIIELSDSSHEDIIDIVDKMPEKLKELGIDRNALINKITAAVVDSGKEITFFNEIPTRLHDFQPSKDSSPLSRDI